MSGIFVFMTSLILFLLLSVMSFRFENLMVYEIWCIVLIMKCRAEHFNIQKVKKIINTGKYARCFVSH